MENTALRHFFVIENTEIRWGGQNIIVYVIIIHVFIYKIFIIYLSTLYQETVLSAL